jgi:hypothetical protein
MPQCTPPTTTIKGEKGNESFSLPGFISTSCYILLHSLTTKLLPEIQRFIRPFKIFIDLSVVIYTCNLSTQEAEPGESQVLGQPGLHSERVIPKKDKN